MAKKKRKSPKEHERVVKVKRGGRAIGKRQIHVRGKGC